MATIRERSKPLHNFSMPCLRWGNQRLLRCMKVNSNGGIWSGNRRSSASEVDLEYLVGRRRETELEKSRSLNGTECFRKSPLQLSGPSGRNSVIEGDGDDGIEAIREKLMFDLRAAADKMKVSILEEGKEEDSSVSRPWNLRTRRAACKAPNETGRGGEITKCEDRQHNSSPLRIENSTTAKSLRLRGLAATPAVKKNVQAKFSISLSREQIEDDFMAIMGTRPSRRPKKRAKIVQKQLDTIFPGLWLSEITPDTYKVADMPETGKS